LQSHQALWTPYCALFSLDPNISLTLISNHLDGRLLVAQVTYANGILAPFYVLCLYGPAQHNQRRSFYTQLSNLWPTLFTDHMSRRSFLVGDFNLQLHQCNQAPPAWRQILSTSFMDCITPVGARPEPTFTSTRTRSCIDFIFRSRDIFSNNSSVQFLNTLDWTDHCLVTTSIPLPITTGPGFWRLHPHYLELPEFQEQLSHLFDLLCETSSTNPSSPQSQWDSLKSAVKQLGLTFGRQQSRSRQRNHQYLQRERSRILRSQPHDTETLALIDAEISATQLHHMTTLALRASQRW
ncbi:hypothetical protein BJV82DRAFT_486636, partial [Fennellomyces sp. T-0311]